MPRHHGVYSYARGYVGPLGAGLVLDWAGRADGWRPAFGHFVLITPDGAVF